MATTRRQVLAAAASAPLALAGSAVPASAHVKPEERKSSPNAPFKLAVAAYSYRDFLPERRNPNPKMTLFDFIEVCAGLGTDGVELTEYYFERPITRDQVLRLKRHAHLWGQSITGTPIGNSFTAPAGDERDKQIAAYKDWLDLSADLGSPAVRTFAGGAPKGVSESDARKNVIETLNLVAEHAAKRGVFIAMENHGGVVAKPEGLLEIVKAVDSPWVGINLDTGNFRTDDPYRDLALCAPYAVTVQYKVEMFPAGGGAQPADFARILKILRAANYRGFVTLEYEAKEDPMVAVPRHVKEMRRAMLAEVQGA
jgi:sugar phosphate isomerase/epimerase